MAGVVVPVATAVVNKGLKPPAETEVTVPLPVPDAFSAASIVPQLESTSVVDSGLL
jgi:hypothetical protein